MNHFFKKNYLIIFKSINNSSNQEIILNLSKYLYPLQNQDVRYAGHSKWQNIRHTKASKDGEKSKLFNKLANSITKSALKGADPKYNKELSNLLELCKKQNVSRDLVDRALKRAQTQKLVSKSRGFIGPNNLIGLANFLYDPRITGPNQFLRDITKSYKDYKFVDAKTLMSFFEKKGVLLISKYDKNFNPVVFEKIEEVAIESEAEEIKITCEEDKEIPPLPDTDSDDKKSSKRDPRVEEDPDSVDETFCWKLITSEEGLFNAKGIIEKNYPDLVIKSTSIDYLPKEPIDLNEKEMEKLNKFYQDLNELEEFDKVFTNVI